MSEYTLRSRWFMLIYFNSHQLPPSSSAKSQWNICSDLSSHFPIFLIIPLYELQVRNKGWTQAIPSTAGNLLPFFTSHLDRKGSPHQVIPKFKHNRTMKRFWMCSWRIKWIATISSSTQRSGNAFCTQWKVCPRLFGIASNLLIQNQAEILCTRIHLSSKEKIKPAIITLGKHHPQSPQGLRQLPKEQHAGSSKQRVHNGVHIIPTILHQPPQLLWELA